MVIPSNGARGVRRGKNEVWNRGFFVTISSLLCLWWCNKEKQTMSLLVVVAYKPQVDKIHLLTLHVIIKSQVVNSIMLQLS